MSAVEADKRRFMAFVAIDAACLVLAGAAAVGAFVYDVEPLLWVLVAAVAAGFAAQIWLIAGLRRANKGVR